jgi:hypothetical protein
MDELIQNIMKTINKKGVQTNCKKILKKCNFKSAKDTSCITELAVWLYIYGNDEAAIGVCDLFQDTDFNGNYTLWENVDHALCLKARILREHSN